jgi:hypothetical protein
MTTRVETKYKGNQMLFIQRDGTSAVHPYEFNFKGVDYYLLGGVYYDLEPALIKHLFKEQ